MFQITLPIKMTASSCSAQMKKMVKMEKNTLFSISWLLALRRNDYEKVINYNFLKEN